MPLSENCIENTYTLKSQYNVNSKYTMYISKKRKKLAFIQLTSLNEVFYTIHIHLSILYIYEYYNN